ncbi:MAG: response regulator [Ferruginibacter sp.]
MKTPIRFIIIDDDSTNNLLCGIMIEAAAGESRIDDFRHPEKGLEYIKEQYSSGTHPTILFLDINMPTCSGWEFLDLFEKLDEKIKDQFKIYMLSSSLNPGDQQRALENENVVDYLEKPLSESTVLSILNSQNGLT